jgi:hypothetical protein
MAGTSAWLAIVFGLFVMGKQIYINAIFGVPDLFPVSGIIYSFLPALLALAGGFVVLKRLKPGLRLLCTARSFIVGQTLLQAIQIYQTYRVGERMAVEKNDATAAVLADEGVWPYVSDELVMLSICLCGLALALLARRPHYKG